MVVAGGCGDGRFGSRGWLDLLRTSDGPDGHAVVLGSLYLLVHGLAKVVLVLALLRSGLWA